MNHTQTNKRLSPVMLVTVYKDKGNSNFYLEKRDIKTINGKSQFMAPVPLPDETMRSIAKNYSRKNNIEMSFGTIVPEHIIHASNKPGKTMVVWYRPATLRKLNFSSQLKIKGESTVNLPGLLFMIINSKLYVFALMDDQRPDLKTKLYNAPFFNIYEDGNVCLGTAKVGSHKEKTYSAEAERFERGFFMAEQNGGAFKDKCKTSLSTLWNQLIKSKAKFPCKTELIQHKTYRTVNDLISKFNTDEE